GAYDTCSRCDYTTYVEIPALDHDLEHHEAKAATCTEIGWGAYDTCSRCDYTTYVEIPALDHDLEHHEAKAATCTEIGWGAYDTCSRCDYTTYVEIPALDHDLEHHEAKAATCTEIGWNAYDTCSRCDYTTYVEIPAHGHDYVAVVTDPTCTEAGFTTHTCSRCGDSYADTPVDAIGHEWDTEVIMWQWRGVTEATATFWCVHDGSHTVVLSAEITKADGIGDDAGYMVYTATVTMGIEVFSDVQKIQKHLVTFVDDDEETVLSEEQIVLHGETAMKPVDPTRKFYTFKGWYLGETLYDFASPVTSDIELRAGWDLVLSFSVTATMEDNFNLNFYIYNLADKDASDVTVYWVFDGKEYEQNLGQLNRYDNNRYRVVLTELFAFQMTFNISIQVKCEGKIVMTQDTFCLRDYFEYLTNNLEDDKMEEIARAALDYGTAAQQYFDGRTYDNGIPYDVNIDSLANQNTNPENTMPSVDKPDNSVSLANTVEGLSVKTASLIFGTETSIKVYFTYTGDISKLSISCDNGKVPTAVVLESDGRYSICIKKIRSYELYKDYTISFADDTGTAQLVYSPYAYAAYNWDSNTSGLSRLVRTLVAYGEIARLLWPNN
ncbi:MAG: InlB B-repeat-containing protein, partial [Lachnospiraceae bacterium]|nr:InlB B-repeat-containing protein [Lachnospiraceae bacterium]